LGDRKQTITAAPTIRRRTVFDWYELKLTAAGYAAGGAAGAYAERVFFLPDMDATIPIAEGPAPADWVGYHAGKHGLMDRFENLKGEEVKMGELFFGEKYRWVNPDHLKNPNELLPELETEFNAKLDRAYRRGAPRVTEDLSGLFDSNKFTQDIKTLFDKYKGDTKSTVWQGKYIYKNKAGEVTGYGDLQTNIDFIVGKNKCRLALDAKTGKALNFFRIEENPQWGPMQFSETVLKWKGTVTDVTKHTVQGETLVVEISSNWSGLFKQGCKSGALTGGLVAAFFGAISGFKQRGLIGALEGLAVGFAVGATFGAAIGGVVSLAARIWPIVGKIAKVGGLVMTFVSVMLDSVETGLDPQEWASKATDKDGNTWRYRHVQKVGTFFVDYIPHGIRVDCTDGTVMEFGENEWGNESSYDTRTPINAYASGKKLNWHMTRTPEGSSMWWWQDQNTKEEFAVSYASDDVMFASTKRKDEEAPFRFVPTQN
jgi:hypothetical protein